MKPILLALFALCCLSATALGKGRSSLSGKVTDADGKGLVTASISLQKTFGAPIVKVVATGAYMFPNLDSGEYSAFVTAPGYESQRITGIIASGEELALDIQLNKSGSWGSSIASRRYVPQVKATVSRDVHRPGSPKRERDKVTLKVGHSSGVTYSGAGGVGAEASYGASMAGPPHPGGRADRAAYKSMSAPSTDGLIAMESASSPIGAAPGAHAGMLTSGEINDFAKWTLWEDMSMEALKGYRSEWPFRPEARYTVLVKSKTGTPLCNARVKMSSSSGQVWEAITDNTGKAELWYGMWGAETGAAPRLSAAIEYGREHFTLPALKPFSEGANILTTNTSCLNPAKLDIAFIVDATGSMGDEINYLKEELRDILQKVQDSMPAIQVQTGALFYRDLEDVYLTRASDLTPDFSKTEAFIEDNSAEGGGDTPEAVDAALEEGLKALHWRSDATARLAFLVLDAPPHGDAATVKRMQQLTAQYAARGIRLIPVVCSGSDKPTEYLMRSIALATNGTYLFLTDHSGIGGSHTAPTTDKYDVEYLNGLIYRVIYNCAYMPTCKEETARQRDTAWVEQQTDSATIINWRYYPNPTTGVLHIQHTHTSGYLFITDVTGKAILRVPADASGNTTIDLTQYPAGIYAIRYSWADDKWLSGKFVLVH